MDRIGRYEILGELGRGAMGVVYRALDPTIGRTLAIKTIRLSALADERERSSLRDRLFREAQAAGMLSHPNIVTVYDVAQEDDLAYIAMECVEGLTLDRMLMNDPPDRKLLFVLLTQTAAALDYAHKRGIVHRDIKPANIMIHERTTAKITDFGIAKIQSQQMTHGGALLGTPNYMSPEQIQGLAIDGRADQFSLAVIAYELLTGEKPFAAESMPALVFKIVREDPAPPQTLNPTLGWPVETVLRRGLAKAAEERYPSCSDFVFALENACRASKNWKPVAPGSIQDLPTLVPTSKGPEAAKPVPAVVAPPIAAPRFLPEEEAPPKALRVARALAVIVVSAGLVSSAMVGALRYFSPPDQRYAPEAVQDETLGTDSERPSAMGSTNAPPVAALPGDSPERETQNPSARQPGPSAEGTRADVEDLTGGGRLGRTPPPEASARNAGEGVARFVTYPPGATVTVDGQSDLSCRTPCTLPLGPGRHTLAATLDGHRRTLKIFELPQDSELMLTLERTTGTLMVKSEPEGASILINGKMRPEKTPAMITLPSGRYTVEIVKDENRNTQEVVVRESVMTNVGVEWPRNGVQ